MLLSKRKHCTLTSIELKIRPCVRRKFSNFSFSRVSEMFGFRSSEIFRKKPEFSNSRNFCEKVWKKVRKFKFRKKFGNYSKIL
jgi:hypothetical protein